MQILCKRKKKKTLQVELRLKLQINEGTKCGKAGALEGLLREEQFAKIFAARPYVLDNALNFPQNFIDKN